MLNSSDGWTTYVWMFNDYLIEAKDRVFEFDYQKRNEHIWVHSIFEKWCSRVSLMFNKIVLDPSLLDSRKISIQL